MREMVVTALAAAILTAAAAFSEEPSCPRIDGHWGWGGSFSVEVAGGVGVFDSGASLVVADWSSAARPVILGRARVDGEPTGITIDGSTAYVTVADVGLQIIDLSAPTNPDGQGTWRTAHFARAVAVSSDHAFVADFDGGLRVIDVSDPRRPAEVAALDLGAQVGAHDVELLGRYAMVAAGRALVVVDVEAPTQPVEVARLVIDGFAPRLAVDGSIVWLLGGHPDLIGIDVSDPLNPSYLGGLELPGLFRDLDAKNGLVYVAATSTGLHVVDGSVPGQPILAATVELAGWAQDVSATAGGVLVAMGNDGVAAVDVSVAAEPTPVGSWIRPAPAAEVWDMAVAGEHLIVADHSSEDGRLWVLDITDPRRPVEVGWVGLPSDGVAVDLLPGMAVVAHVTLFVDILVDGGLTLVDLSDPTAPTVTGTYPVDGGVTDVVAESGAAYLVNEGELAVVDLSTPSAPTEIARYAPEATYLLSVDVVDRLAYAVGDYGLICVADVAAPAQPVNLGCTAVADSTQRLVAVAVRGTLAAVIVDPGPGGQDRLLLLDVGDPVSPAVLSWIPAAGRSGTLSAAQVLLVGDLAVVSLGLDNGVQIFDVRDPSNPRPIGERMSPSYSSTGMATDGDRVFVAAGRGGVDSYRLGSCLAPRRSAARVAP